MIKFYEELKKDYVLPLIDKYKSDKKELLEFRFPNGYISKYRHLFVEGKILLIIFNFFDDEKLYSIKSNNINEEISNWELMDMHNRLKEDLEYYTSETDKIDSSAKDVYFNLLYLMKISDFLSIIYPKDNYYKKIHCELVEASRTLREYNTIKNISIDKRKNIILPNVWYINSFGDLFNPTSTSLISDKSHKTATLYNQYEFIKVAVNEKMNLDHVILENIEKRKSIIENGFITRADFKYYLNYIYDFSSIDETDYFYQTCHNKNIVNLVIGIIGSSISLYKFYNNIIKYCKNPKEEIKKLNSMTSNDFRDILVRCCGFHKIEATLNNTITTSSLNYEDDFSLYIKRGWNINFIPPIIVNKEKGIVEELNVNSLIVKNYIKSLKKVNKC